MLIMLAIFNACTVISRFTRVAEELFGMLITVLFFQEAIKVFDCFLFQANTIDCDFGNLTDKICLNLRD
jgi:hypothetical protein